MNRAKSREKEISSEIITALCAGDHIAYEQVYYHYSDSIRRFLITLTRSEDMAEEITQETFIKIWEKRDSIDSSKNFKTYLYTIARNAALSYFNREQIRTKYSRLVLPEEEDYSSDELIIARETEILIGIAVSRMPKMRRRVFELSRYEGWPNEKIADELHISRSNVYDHLYQATKDIKEVISVFIMLFVSQG